MDDLSGYGLPPAIVKALESKGFSVLTDVQRAVIKEGAEGRDLRISSQTGSGKTLAFGFVLLRELGSENVNTPKQVEALVLTPTRELATQVQKELAWVLAPLKKRVLAVTGGTSVREEARSLQRGADVLVGTPGRLVDHLDRKNLDPSAIRTVVLDEADQMLDLGFREALAQILGALPTERRSHLVSATFSRDVLALANRYQKDPLSIEGTRLGAANTDISHVVCLVSMKDRANAVMNTLLLHPGESTLIFVRMRADAAKLTEILNREHFAAAALSGDLAQGERTRTLDAFRAGKLRILVATDVAARGLDVEGITRVIHGDPPGNAESYTHRSGRTGRAGKKGESIMLVTPDAVHKARMLLRRARIDAEWRAAPSAAVVQKRLDERRIHDIGEAARAETKVDARRKDMITKLLASAPTDQVVRALLERLDEFEPHTPFEVKEMLAPRDKDAPRGRFEKDAPRGRFERDSRDEGPRSRDRQAPRPSERRESSERPEPRERREPREARDPREARVPREAREPRESRDVREPREPRTNDRHAARTGDRLEPRHSERAAPREHARDKARGDVRYTAFTINWGERHGADPRRLMALVCRRGDIRGSDVGAIRIDPLESFFEVASHLAPDFTRAAARRDARDPGLRIHALKAPRLKPRKRSER